MKFIRFVAILSLMAWMAPAANAVLVTYRIDATVDTVEDPSDVLNGSVATGDTLTGILQYDLSLPDTIADADTGFYEAFSPEENFIEGANGASGFFETIDFFGALVLNEDNPSPVDQLLFFAAGDTTPSSLDHPSINNVNMAISLVDEDGTVFSDDSLPANLNLSDFEIADMEFSADDGDSQTSEFVYFVGATITRIIRVPEPSSILLLGVASMVLLPRRRSKRGGR